MSTDLYGERLARLEERGQATDERIRELTGSVVRMEGKVTQSLTEITQMLAAHVAEENVDRVRLLRTALWTLGTAILAFGGWAVPMVWDHLTNQGGAP